MRDQPIPEHEQAQLWNGPGGEAWVALQGTLDALLAPFEALLAEAIAPGGAVLDVGCGAGATTLAAARRLGPGGACLGVDISAPLIEAARARAAREGSAAQFVRADAQSYGFEPGAYGRIVSRFGVMFFADFVAAFANLRRAAAGGGVLDVIAWRAPADNPFMTAAERAAKPYLPELPAREPDAPGQFAFADADFVRSVLARSGWEDVEIVPLDVACALPAAELERYFTRLGPLGRVLAEVAEPTRSEIVSAVRNGFEPFVEDGVARFVAACWRIGARAPFAGAA